MLTGTCAEPNEIGEMMRQSRHSGHGRIHCRKRGNFGSYGWGEAGIFPCDLGHCGFWLRSYPIVYLKLVGVTTCQWTNSKRNLHELWYWTLSPVNMANSVIGQAWSLMSSCWVDIRPRKNMWSSLGSSLNYNNNCCAENEEDSVWKPFTVQNGFKIEESVVSIFRGWVFANSTGTASVRSIGEKICLQMSTIPPTHSSATFVVNPSIARMLKEKEGFTNKQ